MIVTKITEYKPYTKKQFQTFNYTLGRLCGHIDLH